MLCVRSAYIPFMSTPEFWILSILFLVCPTTATPAREGVLDSAQAKHGVRDAAAWCKGRRQPIDSPVLLKGSGVLGVTLTSDSSALLLRRGSPKPTSLLSSARFHFRTENHWNCRCWQN